MPPGQALHEGMRLLLPEFRIRLSSFYYMRHVFVDSTTCDVLSTKAAVVSLRSYVKGLCVHIGGGGSEQRCSVMMGSLFVQHACASSLEGLFIRGITAQTRGYVLGGRQ
jgi:hypothetical protein